MKILALILVAVTPLCTPILVCPEPEPVQEREYLPLRIVQAEFITEVHWMGCFAEESPIPSAEYFDCVRTLEVHTESARCLARAAEAFQWCVLGQRCLGTIDGCQEAYNVDRERCGDSDDWALVLRSCRDE